MSLHNYGEDKTEYPFISVIELRPYRVISQKRYCIQLKQHKPRNAQQRDAHSIEQFISEQEDLLNQSIGSVGINNTSMDDCTDIDIPESVFHNVESSCQIECSCSCSCAQSSKRPSRTQTETRMSTEEIYLLLGLWT